MKKVKLYAVIWTNKAMKEYGVPKNERIISVEPKEDIKVNVSKSKIGRPKYLYTDPLAVFNDEKDAEAFRDGNKDWITVNMQIIIQNPNAK